MGTMWVRVGVLAGLAFAQGLALTGTARADAMSVQVLRGQLFVQAAAGQVNKLTISHVDDTLVITDGVLMTAGEGCVAVSKTRVHCEVRGVGGLHISLADQDDVVQYSGTLPTTQFGGAGSDTLTGGAGNDVLYGDGSSSTPACASLPSPGCKDTLYGNGGADKLYGGEWGDVYWGGPGDDVLDDPATSGGSFLNGGTGNDIIDGSMPNMRDAVDYSERVGGVQVDLAAGKGGEPGELDTILNVQDINGGAGDDTLIGNAWSNRIIGNAGIDTIDGGGGPDMCAAETVTNCA